MTNKNMPHEGVSHEDIAKFFEPGQEQISDYFRRLGLGLRKYFQILKAPEFEASGTKAKREGWFMGYHAIVEAAFALKMAELSDLPEEETSLLLQAAMLGQANKRRMYETGRYTKHQDMFESRLEAEQKLADLVPDLDPRVPMISRGGSLDYPIKFIEGRLDTGTLEEQLVDRLEGYYSFVHGCVETTIDRSKEPSTRKTEIISWEERSRIASERHAGGVATETKNVGGKEMLLRDIEKLALAAVEGELKNRINAHRPGTIDEVTPLSTLIRREIMRDIQNKKEIKLPASKI